jgi:chromosome segregation ATPase
LTSTREALKLEERQNAVLKRRTEDLLQEEKHLNSSLRDLEHLKDEDCRKSINLEKRMRKVNQKLSDEQEQRSIEAQTAQLKIIKAEKEFERQSSLVQELNHEIGEKAKQLLSWDSQIRHQSQQLDEQNKTIRELTIALEVSTEQHSCDVAAFQSKLTVATKKIQQEANNVALSEEISRQLHHERSQHAESKVQIIQLQSEIQLQQKQLLVSMQNCQDRLVKMESNENRLKSKAFGWSKVRLKFLRNLSSKENFRKILRRSFRLLESEIQGSSPTS